MKISKLVALFTALFTTLLFSINLQAQAPQSINYQAVVRDASGVVVVNKAVSFRLSILTGSSTGAFEYIETHNVTTNAFGLVTLNIGLGTPRTGAMANVSWATGSKFLRVEVDIAGGTNYTVLGTTQFLSVPFALYAAASGNSAASGWGLTGNATTSANFIGTTNADDLRFYTEGSQKMVVKANGNVGIGTQTPTNRLHIEGDEDGFGSSERVFLKLKNNSTSAAANVGQMLQSGTKGTFTVMSHHSSTYTVSENSDDMGQVWSTGKGLILRASPAAANQNYQGSIRFYTGWNPNSTFASTERMRVEANGNVGIGTTTPDARLTIEGTSSGDDRTFLTINNKSTSSDAQVSMRFTAGGGSNGTFLGHISPTYSLVANYANFGQLASNGNGLIVQAANGILRFQTGIGPANIGVYDRMTILNNGNIGVGTGTPKAKLEITDGDVYVNDAAKGIILKSPNGNCWRVTMDNTGNFVRTSITCPN